MRAHKLKVQSEAAKLVSDVGSVPIWSSTAWFDKFDCSLMSVEFSPWTEVEYDIVLGSAARRRTVEVSKVSARVSELEAIESVSIPLKSLKLKGAKALAIIL